MAHKGYKGKFKPVNYKKYKGDPTNIVYRSLWERKAMRHFDTNPNVLEWSSEEIVVPYYDPVQSKWRRYFPDFVIKIRLPDGSTRVKMLEVKPEKETKEPQKQKRVTKKYITEVTTWGTNQAKWKAAQEYCSDRKWDFQIITEKELGIK